MSDIHIGLPQTNPHRDRCIGVDKLALDPPLNVMMLVSLVDGMGS